MKLVPDDFVVQVEVDPDPDLRCFKCFSNRDGVSFEDPILILNILGEPRKYVCDYCALNFDRRLTNAALAAIGKFPYSDRAMTDWVPILSVDWFDLHTELEEIPDIIDEIFVTGGALQAAAPEEVDHA